MSMETYPASVRCCAKTTSSGGSGVQPRNGNVSRPVNMSVRVGIVGNDAWRAWSSSRHLPAKASRLGVRTGHQGHAPTKPRWSYRKVSVMIAMMFTGGS